eukprot:2461233-Amphidinium_carterae.1
MLQFSGKYCTACSPSFTWCASIVAVPCYAVGWEVDGGFKALTTPLCIVKFPVWVSVPIVEGAYHLPVHHLFSLVAACDMRSTWGNGLSSWISSRVCCVGRSHSSHLGRWTSTL